MSQAITVENLGKRYRIGLLKHETMLRDVLAGIFKRNKTGQQETFWALRNITFNIQQGEVVGVVGRNGAGKSTLLKVLSRITYPTEGTMRVRGRVSALLEVGTGFHEELTGRENIALNGSILGMPQREVNAKLDEIIDFADVEKFIDTPIKRYSSGMRLRLGFAVAAHLEPDVMLVDEVLAVGDAAFQKKCLNAMDDLHGGGRTVVFVSHNMEAIENLCPRVIWIDNGQIRMDGEADTVIREYLSTFSTLQKEGVDLANYEPREGNGNAKVTRVEILSPEGQPIQIIRSGDGLKVRIYYEVYKRIPEPHFGFRLTTELGTMITDLSTWSTGLEIPELQPCQGSIDFDIDFLNLMPGRYYLTLWIQGVGPIKYDILDNFMVLDVDTSNYFDSGRGISSKFGLVFFPCRWRLRNTSHGVLSQSS